MMSANLSKFLQFSNSILHLKIPKTMSFFEVLHFNTSWLFAILQYCNTTFLKSNAILQKSRKSIAILKCNTAILQYWKSALIWCYTHTNKDLDAITQKLKYIQRDTFAHKLFDSCSCIFLKVVRFGSNLRHFSTRLDSFLKS